MRGHNCIGLLDAEPTCRKYAFIFLSPCFQAPLYRSVFWQLSLITKVFVRAFFGGATLWFASNLLNLDLEFCKNPTAFGVKPPNPGGRLTADDGNERYANEKLGTIFLTWAKIKPAESPPPKGAFVFKALSPNKQKN
ncbi:MAG: hypothetical protein H6559_01130 [Lewinellaceae bacterium]|nr:hypothetical protein [Lewinellaceae bacterium]